VCANQFHDSMFLEFKKKFKKELMMFSRTIFDSTYVISPIFLINAKLSQSNKTTGIISLRELQENMRKYVFLDAGNRSLRLADNLQNL